MLLSTHAPGTMEMKWQPTMKVDCVSNVRRNFLTLMDSFVEHKFASKRGV